MQTQATKWIIFLTLVVINLVLLWKIGFVSLLSGSVPLWDFDIYYQMVGDVVHGMSPYALPYMQTSGPPLVILFFVPFSLVPLGIARGLMAAVNLAAILGTAYILAKKYNRGWWPAVTLAFSAVFLLTFPVRFNFIVGQPNPVLMLLVAWLLTTPSANMKGIAAGMMAVIKTNYLLVAVSFWRNQRRSLQLMAGIVVIAGLVSVLLFRPSSYLDFLTTKGSSFVSSAPVTTDVDYYNQSLRATMARFHAGEFYPIIFSVAVVAGLVYLSKTGDIKASLVLSLLLSPVVWQHYIPVIYPLVMVIGMEVWKQKHLRWWWLCSTILVTIHLPHIHGLPVSFLNSLGSSHYFFGLLILLSVCVVSFQSTLQTSFDTV